jgi:Putative mono-oxygenase ydhR
MIVAIVRFTLPTPLTLAEGRAAFEASAPSYQHIRGLMRKHYLLAEDGASAGGVYIWETKAQAEETYNEAWRERLIQRYGAAPTVEYFDSPVSVDHTAITVG